MLSQRFPNEVWLARLKEHLEQQRYSPQTTRRRIAVAGRFIAYLSERRIPIETVEPFSVSLYLRNELRLFRQRRGRPPTSSMADWRRSHTAGINMLLHLVHGRWPPAPKPTDPLEVFHCDLCEQYDGWMRDLRGLALETRFSRCAEARRFLAWLAERGTAQPLSGFAIADVDAYMTFRARFQRRSSVRELATSVRDFMRFLHATGRITGDLGTTVVGPTLYAFESLPSLLQPEDIERVLETTRLDHSGRGLRDYAILMLLSSYGLRAGEVTSLRLHDVDWRRDVLRIHHAKTGGYSELPLLPAVGNAVLDYLGKGRPQTDARAVFIVHHAPYGPFRSGSSLYWLVRNRLTAAGVDREGRQGPHTFRHARAVSLLRAAVPPKQIGDILGHRSAESTAVYLKLATEDLRAVALEIPEEVKA